MSGAAIVVLGAGPAGLGLAFRAAGQGHRVTVIERQERVGGAAGSFTVDGVRVDHGSHRLHGSISPVILEELRGIIGGDLQRRVRRGRIRLANRWLPFPLSPLATVRNLPPGMGLRAGVEAIGAWARQPQADTFAESVRAGLGPTMLDRFYGPYARKLWGLEPDRISGEQARRRVGVSRPSKLLRRALAGREERTRTFLYPRRGFGQLWEALAEAAERRGVRLLLGTTATAVEYGQHGVRVRVDGAAPVAGRHLFTTVPLPALVGLLAPAAPPAVRAAAAALRTRAMVLVYLTLDIPRFSAYDAHYLPEGWTPVTRFSEPKNYRDNDAGDPADRTVLCFEVPCDRGDAMWSASDDVLRSIALAALDACGLAAPSVRGVQTRRLASAYPVYDLGFERRLAQVDAWIGTLPVVTTFGRQGLFVHDNSHHALAMAWAAAEALDRSGQVDPRAWQAARQRFATHVVED